MTRIESSNILLGLADNPYMNATLTAQPDTILNKETLRRQECFRAQLHMLIAAYRRDTMISVVYGDAQSFMGFVHEVAAGVLHMRLGPKTERWIPLSQVTAFDGIDLQRLFGPAPC